MKKRTYAIEFACILLFFVLPPLALPPATPAAREATYPPQTFLCALVAALLVYAHHQRHAEDAATTRTEQKTETAAAHRMVNALVRSGAVLSTFGVLCCSQALLSLLAAVVPAAAPSGATLLPPHTALGWLNCAAGTLSATFYEEALYRQYLPKAATVLFASGSRHLRIRRVLCEAGAVVLFAAAHRYLGVLGVANALIGGIALRRCLVRTRSLVPPFAAHTAYNALMLLFSFLQQAQA